MRTDDEPRPSPVQLALAALKHWTGLDRAIAFTITARFWAASAGLVTVLLIARFLTPSEQGYYYTFNSMVALQIVFELGLSFVILQLAAHESVRLVFSSYGGVEGNAVAHSRLASVLQKSLRWYSVAGVLMAVTLLPGGLYFFSMGHHASTVVGWKLPWCLLVLAVLLTFPMNPVFSFLEGCGFVPQVARMRLGQAMLGSVLAWAALATHHGLLSPAMMVSGQAVVGALFLLSGQQRRLLVPLLLRPKDIHSVEWRREIWPLQWKIAISWLCGYFIFSLFNPVLFAYQGPVAAGQMGMSLSITFSLGAVAIAWINTKASPFGQLIARNEIAELDRAFFRALWQSTTLLIIAATGFFCCLLIASRHFTKLANRVLPPWAFGLLLLTTVMNHVVFSEALYLRAHKREPFLVFSVVSAALLTTSTFVCGRFWGANAMAVGYLMFGGIFGLITGTCIFVTKKKEWHGGLSIGGRVATHGVRNND